MAREPPGIGIRYDDWCLVGDRSQNKRLPGVAMPRFEEHCAHCLERLGAEFREVHLWLDEFCGKRPYGTRHRHLRHHLEGIEEVRRLWGDQAAKAAELHVKQDLAEEGATDIPKSSADYKKIGLW